MVQDLKENITNIQIRKSTRDRLGQLGRMNETYSDFIDRLLDLYERHLERMEEYSKRAEEWRQREKK